MHILLGMGLYAVALTIAGLFLMFGFGSANVPTLAPLAVPILLAGGSAVGALWATAVGPKGVLEWQERTVPWDTVIKSAVVVFVGGLVASWEEAHSVQFAAMLAGCVTVLVGASKVRSLEHFSANRTGPGGNSPRGLHADVTDVLPRPVTSLLRTLFLAVPLGALVGMTFDIIVGWGMFFTAGGACLGFYLGFRHFSKD